MTYEDWLNDTYGVQEILEEVGMEDYEPSQAAWDHDDDYDDD